MTMAVNESDLAALDVAAGFARDYRRRMASAPTTPAADYETIHARFDRPVPESGSDASAMIRELVEGAEDGLRAITAPRFFAWVNGSSHLAGVAADWLTSAWGQNGAGVAMTPAGAAVEAVAARWLLELLGLAPDCSVGLVTGATVANFVGLAAARNEQLRKVGWNVGDDGLFGAPPVTVLVGADAHSTVFQALRYLGFGAKRVETIATDSLGRMFPGDFERALRAADGPVIAIGQAGQINTGVSDPFTQIVPLVRAADGWLHVDGAFGLWALASEDHRHLVAGVEDADSWATDGHKWLQTPYDCGFAICRNESAHRRAMDLTASYLAPPSPTQRHPGAYVPELSRRARGFATWAMIRRLGRSGIARMVQEDVRLAGHMAATIERIEGVTLVNQPELNQFVVRFGADRGDEESDRLTLATVERIQRDAIAFMGPAQWRGRWVMRVSVCSIATSEADADMTVEAVRQAWEAVQSER
jgi:glutamate/tyrosine decarboxylase-like PLP-dependent enzyme